VALSVTKKKKSFKSLGQVTIDKSRIQKGKKKFGAKNANALLNDKSHLSGSSQARAETFKNIVCASPDLLYFTSACLSAGIFYLNFTLFYVYPFIPSAVLIVY
jgi:hypothetical protein